MRSWRVTELRNTGQTLSTSRHVLHPFASRKSAGKKTGLQKAEGNGAFSFICCRTQVDILPIHGKQKPQNLVSLSGKAALGARTSIDLIVRFWAAYVDCSHPTCICQIQDYFCNVRSRWRGTFVGTWGRRSSNLGWPYRRSCSYELSNEDRRVRDRV